MYKDRIVRVKWRKGQIQVTSYGRLMDAECIDATSPKTVLLSRTDYGSSMEEPDVLLIDADKVVKIDTLSVEKQG